MNFSNDAVQIRTLPTKLAQYFFYAAGALLFFTSIAKLISAMGGAGILQNKDPLFSFSFQHIFVVVGSIEMIIAAACFFGKGVATRAVLIAWLATSFIAYRMGLLWVHYQRPCPCLGNITDALHIAPETADRIMKIILIYLLIGSYGLLFWLWRQKRKLSRSSVPKPFESDSQPPLQ